MNSSEPVIAWGTLGALIGALLASLLNQYAPSMGGDLINAIVELAVFLVPVLGGLWFARSKVTPVAKLEDSKK